MNHPPHGGIVRCRGAAQDRANAVAALRARVEEDFGPDAARSLAPLDRFDGVAWDPPEAPLSAWLEVDRLLVAHPQLREQVRMGVFGRLLESQPPARLLAARPECLPALAFWGCLRLAESPDCPDDLRQQARRRMKLLDPELHALFMRHTTRG